MEDNKNQLFLAHVLQELRRRDATAWRCTFAGPITDTVYAEGVREALEGLTSVECVGELDEDAVDDLYRHADLLLLPSKEETFGMVVREAAAAAIPFSSPQAPGRKRRWALVVHWRWTSQPGQTCWSGG